MGLQDIGELLIESLSIQLIHAQNLFEESAQRSPHVSLYLNILWGRARLELRRSVDEGNAMMHLTRGLLDLRCEFLPVRLPALLWRRRRRTLVRHGDPCLPSRRLQALPRRTRHSSNVRCVCACAANEHHRGRRLHMVRHVATGARLMQCRVFGYGSLIWRPGDLPFKQRCACWPPTRTHCALGGGGTLRAGSGVSGRGQPIIVACLCVRYAATSFPVLIMIGQSG